MCSLRCRRCLPSVGRKEIPQIQYINTFPFPSFLLALLFQNGPIRGSFSPQNKVGSILESEISATP